MIARNVLVRGAVALGCGTLFGAGLAVSQMSNPEKVLNFLDIFGTWDPSLLLVLASAAGVTMIAFRFVRRMRAPIFETSFEPEPGNRIDARLITGAATFGVGWGLSGFCPGPAVVALGRLAPEAALFAVCFFVGSWLYRMSKANAQRSRVVAPQR
jgi:uncharacterized membrane protein YedE/YeeE